LAVLITKSASEAAFASNSLSSSDPINPLTPNDFNFGRAVSDLTNAVIEYFFDEDSNSFVSTVPPIYPVAPVKNTLTCYED